VLVILLKSLGLALGAVVLAFFAALLISYALKLGDLGILLMLWGPPLAGICAFVISVKRLRTYMSR
jgi:hypothetical protein